MFNQSHHTQRAGGFRRAVAYEGTKYRDVANLFRLEFDQVRLV